MYITKEEYAGYGYSVVPETEFTRYAFKAEVTVREYTFDRINDADLRPDTEAGSEVKRIAEMNQRGVCEVLDVLYKQDQVVIGELGAPIKSVTNEGVSETLDTSGQDASEVRRKIRDIMHIFFTSEQLFRGVT